MNLQTIFIFILYQIIQIFLIPFIPIYLLIRAFKKKPIVGNFCERLGLVPKNKTVNKKTIWIHAVSVGEILSIQNLIKKIKSELGDCCFYVTTGTITGRNMAKKNIDCDHVSFLPYDFLIPMLFAFKRIKPDKIIIVEAETWPNLLILSTFFKVPSFLINARVNEKSLKKYTKLKFVFKSLFNTFNLILTQSNKDKINFEKLGVKKDKIESLGNIKAFNVLVKKKTEEKKTTEDIEKKFTTLLVGSVHPGELDTYLNLFEKLKSSFKNLKLILAPRHFHWKKELLKKLENKNFSYYLWEKENEFLKEKNKNYNLITNQVFEEKDIFVILKLGELFNIYSTSDIFFLGGTFVPIGGHNLLEPAVWSKVSIVGPYYENCKDIANKLEKINGLFKANNEEELFDKTNFLLKNRDKILAMGINSYKGLKEEAISVEKNLDKLIKNYLK